MTPKITAAITAVKEYKYAWDELQGPMPGLITAIHQYDPVVVQYIVNYVAARVLPCWEAHCENRRPRETITRVQEYLQGVLPAERLKDDITETRPCVDDCRYSDTMSASMCIAMTAAFMLDGEPLTAASAIEHAKIAFEHIFTNDGFVDWLTGVAIPIAFEKRCMTEEELARYCVNDFTREVYSSFFHPLQQQPFAAENKTDISPVVESGNKNWWKFW